MSKSDEFMINAQARLISELRERNERLEKKVQELQKMKPYADFYRTLQQTLIDNPDLLAEWQTFIISLKMRDPDDSKYADIIRKHYNEF